MDLVLLAAGASTRYTTPRPKYWLTMYDGRNMLQHAIDPFLDQVDHIHVVILKEHDTKYNVSPVLKEFYGNRVTVVALDALSAGPACSAMQALELLSDRRVFIKDCDSLFTTTLPQGNFICVDPGHNDLNKSYVAINDNIIDIKEKQTISDTACVGGYGFSSSRQFVDTVKQLSVDSEVYISRVIKKLLDQNFIPVQVNNYIDLGTSKDFIEYNRRFMTIFCDVDGTVIKNQAEFFYPNNYKDAPIVLEKNRDRLQALQKQGAELVFVTARNSKYHADIEKLLQNIGFQNFRLLTGLNHSQRILINDYSTTNPDPSAVAINLKRDDDDLGLYL
jgi:dTDP-glucose pyrophosphorylase